MACVSILILLSGFVTISYAEESNINIVCTNSLLADFTSNLIKENATIDYIMPPGVCPAYYDTTPSDVSKIINADIIISFGSPFMEPWLSDLLEYNSNCSVIECKNMGEWNIPAGAKKYVEYLTNELSKLLPDLNETIHINSQTYISEINNTAQELQNLIETNGFIGKNVISMKWQKEFLEWLGLNVIYSYGPPQGLSSQDQLNVINAASTNDTCAIVDNLQSGTDFGARVASETGASHIIFTNFPGAIPGTSTYLDMITYNTEQLIKGIQTYEYKQGDISKLQNQVSDLELQRNIVLLVAIIFAILAVVLFIMYKKK
jgi:ABC-type Zn uptake system ZnuABC Zn-binding protein ZnuA